MNKYEFLKELKELNLTSYGSKYTLAKLHDVMHFDFESDLNIIKIDGSFTFNSLKKAAKIDDFSSYNAVVIISNVKYQESRIYAVPVFYNGFGLSFLHRAPYRHDYGFDTFYCKRRFEEVRKEQNIISYLIIQPKELEKAPATKTIDFTVDRLKVLNVTGLGSYNNPNKNGISQFDYLHPLTGEKCNMQINSFESDNINYFIDKSGYFLQVKRVKMRQAAKARKTEKLKNIVNSCDFSNDVIKVVNAFNEKKSMLANMLLTCDYSGMNNISSAIRALDWLSIDIKHFVNASNAKTFSSVESANNSKLAILDKLNKITF